MFDSLFGLPLAARFFIAFLVVLALIGLTAWVVRRFGASRLGGGARGGRQPRLAVIDAASVDGRLACYAVTAEALEEHFGARSWRQEDLLQAMESHRGTIEDMARSLFKLTDSHNIVLRSGHFRFGM